MPMQLSTSKWGDVAKWLDSRPNAQCTQCGKQILLGALDSEHHFPTELSDNNINGGDELGRFAMLWPCSHLTCSECGEYHLLTSTAEGRGYTCPTCTLSLNYFECGHAIKLRSHAMDVIEWADVEAHPEPKSRWVSCPRCSVEEVQDSLEGAEAGCAEFRMGQDIENHHDTAALAILNLESLIRKLKVQVRQMKSNESLNVIELAQAIERLKDTSNYDDDDSSLPSDIVLV